MSDEDLIRRRDATHIVEGWRVLEDDIEAIPAVQTFTAADLKTAWLMGRDTTAQTYWHGAWYRNPDALSAMKQGTPPADLVAQVEEARK